MSRNAVKTLRMNIAPSYLHLVRQEPRTRRRAAISAPGLSALLLSIEAGTVIALALLSGLAYHFFAYGSGHLSPLYLQVGIIAASIYAVANVARRDYNIGNVLSGDFQWRRILIHWHGSFFCLLALGFLAQTSVDYSRAWMVIFYLSGLVILGPLRLLLMRATIAASRSGIVAAKRIFLVGAEPRISAFLAKYQPETLGIEVTGWFLLPLMPGPLNQESVAVLKRELEHAVAQARETHPDAIFLLAPWTASDAVLHGAEKFASLPAELHVGPDRLLEDFRNAELHKLGPIHTIQLTSTPLGLFQQVSKRIFDIVMSSVAIAMLSPLMLVIAILIKLESRGPVFFRQRRFGYNQAEFRIIKFRSMSVMEDGPAVPQAMRDDPRVTRVGRWLRRWNLDELPQLFNVLKGDMSLVGPRPHAIAHNLEYAPQINFYARRNNVKPGITGWAQVHGYRGETDAFLMRKRVEYDIYYIENWSLTLDILILIRTVLSQKSYQNAY
ncbi:MAG: undecaprenyl-phosphate glucose phosphotransferase [Pseudorhodoplanes sp.]